MGLLVPRSRTRGTPGVGCAAILRGQTVDNLTFAPGRRCYARAIDDSPSPLAMRVLIVEDDKVLAHGLTETLRRAGYVVDAVPTAEQAEAALRVTQIDLVILDVGLPGMDGFTWLKRLRARGGEQTVLVLTARDALDDRVHGLTVGADDYLAKPFAPEELLARVAALTRRGRAIRSNAIEH